jgi:hypothetical protein
VFDRFAVIGSANASANSCHNLIEAGIVTDEPAIVSSAKSLVYQLAERAKEIGPAEVAELLKIKVIRRPWIGGRRKNPGPRLGRQFWIAGIHPLKGSYEDEEEFVKEGERKAKEVAVSKRADVSPVRWTGTGNVRKGAVAGDRILYIYKESKSRVYVYPPMPILYRQDQGNWTRLYSEWPRSVEERTISLAAFKKLARQGGLLRVGPLSQRTINDDQVRRIEAMWPT